MQNQPAVVRRTPWRKFLGWGFLFLALLYLLLLLPEADPPRSGSAGKQPFAWNQDLFWSQLEQEFVAARAAGCQSLSNRIDASFMQANRLLAGLAQGPMPADDPLLLALETNFFRLAPMVAACPERLTDYASLVNRLRAAVKQQSERWDLNALPVRQRLYRLLYGTRMALEEAMLQMPGTNALPPLQIGTAEPSGTPATQFLGMTIHSGDILVSRGGAPSSALISRGNDYPGCFSHVALVHVELGTGRACVIEAHIERGVAIASVEEYLRDPKLRILVLRPRAELPALVADPLLPHKAASAALREAQRRHIPYDFALNSRDHHAQFCSEVAAAAYEALGLKLWMGVSYISSPTVTAWLGSLGTRYFETQEPADLEYDPQLRVVAEWREPANLFKAHVHDAVTDVMLAEAPAGAFLEYQKLLLPLARLNKAYSVVLNAFGKVGPVPEGMSATTALRVRKYCAEHDALTAGVLAGAEEFKRKQGYLPPYWELVRLAHEARKGTP